MSANLQQSSVIIGIEMLLIHLLAENARRYPDPTKHLASTAQYLTALLPQLQAIKDSPDELHEMVAERFHSLTSTAANIV